MHLYECLFHAQRFFFVVDKNGFQGNDQSEKRKIQQEWTIDPHGYCWTHG